MHGDEGAEEHQGQHGGAAMQHKKSGGTFLPDFCLGGFLHTVGNQPRRAAREKHRERDIDRKAEGRIKPPERQHLATRS
ncbi:MAG: hypothetical protein USCAAHI_00012 [Beijerinckiaceae bacterium]|jgi:hypothetical protein|nr:MAG: hypothetical protein USCAAHI_00012 [Beijerinckiaceae bacterium]